MVTMMRVTVVLFSAAVATGCGGRVTEPAVGENVPEMDSARPGQADAAFVDGSRETAAEDAFTYTACPETGRCPTGSACIDGVCCVTDTRGQCRCGDGPGCPQSWACCVAYDEERMGRRSCVRFDDMCRLLP
jgi:hypothetical protein